MRTIHTDEITKCIKEMCMQVNVDLSPDVKDALLAGKEKEESTIGKQILEQFYQKTQGEITRSSWRKTWELRKKARFRFVRIPV